MPARSAIYLDSNAGAPLKPQALEALLPFLSLSTPAQGGSAPLLPNPSSAHSHGRNAKKLINEAREKIARSLGANVTADQILLTSSGTEGSQLAIRSALEPALLRGEKPHWITTPVEHDASLQMVQWLKDRGGSVDWMEVDSEGRPRPESLRSLVKPETRLISAIWVNNETGVLTDVSRLAEESARLAVPLHLDGAQAWGKLRLDLLSSQAQWVSFSGHKIGALSGSGVLWSRNPETVVSVFPGKQEKGRRGGTENLLGAIALGAAAAALDPEAWEKRVAPLRNRLEARILELVPGTRVNGSQSPRVANTLSLSFHGIEKPGLVPALDLEGFSVSAGSACSSGAPEPSHVLLAMGRSRAEANASIRVSLADEMDWEDLEEFAQALERAARRMRPKLDFAAAGR